MRKYLIISLLLFLSIGYTQQLPINEVISERHPNGLKKLVNVFQGSGINETLIGKYGFYDSGLKSFIILYKQNKKHGKCTYWNEKGEKIKEGNYNMGQMDGLWTYRYDNGNIKFEGLFSNGDESDPDGFDIPQNGRNGKSSYWYENGQKYWEGTFKDGIEYGLFIGWYV